MNPQFVRTFDDLKRVREQYMNTLELQISNDLYNQTQNELYRSTGQVPIDPTKNMLGFYDFQQLKQQLKKGLLEIMNDTDRNKAVELLSQQPQEMLFALGELNTLISYFKPLYRRTVPYIIFVSYVRNLMKKTFRLNAYDARLQSSNTSNLDGKVKDEVKVKPEMKTVETQSERQPTYTSKEAEERAKRNRKKFFEELEKSQKKQKEDIQKKTTETSTATEPKEMKTSSTQQGLRKGRIAILKKMKDAATDSFIYNPNLYPSPVYPEDYIPIVEEDDDKTYINAKQAMTRERLKQLTSSRKEKLKKEIKKQREKNIMERRGINIIGKGMKTTEQLLPFGKYALNPTHLHKHKLGLKTRNNNSVKKYPVQSISEDVADILKSIGNQQGFDVSVLEDEDKTFLYELLDYAEVPVNLPRQRGSGNADCKDKDLHRFELLKGQVLAGNNAKEIVDELKVLIVKLMNDDRINRKDGQNLLTDLVSLGF